jgi:hypothetical protein
MVLLQNHALFIDSFYSLNMNMLSGCWYIDLEPDVLGSKIGDPDLVLEILIN